MSRLYLYLLIVISLCWSVAGCSDGKIFSGDRIEPNTNLVVAQPKITSNLTEVAPPRLIGQLEPILSNYDPQVKINSPQADEIKTDTKVEVQLQVDELPIYQDEDLKLGPHLHLILDNQPYQKIYDVESPITLENLQPGTHTLRVFAVTPWGESFKNEGAYAQTTFHVLTKTDNNNPNSNLPVLTYNVPQGIYGAEPILLDFYLSNAPLHLAAQQDSEDQIVDWRIKVTINGESFILDTWQSIYLKGFNTGKNWVQLEFIDENGENINNVFNNTVRLLDYDPSYQDGLADLVTGKIDIEQAKKLVVAQPIDLTEPERLEEVEEQILEAIEEIEPEQTPEAVEEIEPKQVLETPSEIEPEPSNTEVEIIQTPSTNEEAKELELEIPNTLTEADPTNSLTPEIEINTSSEAENTLLEEDITTQNLDEIPETIIASPPEFVNEEISETIVSSPPESEVIVTNQNIEEIPETIVASPPESEVKTQVPNESAKVVVKTPEPQEINLIDSDSETKTAPSIIEKIKSWIQSFISNLRSSLAS